MLQLVPPGEDLADVPCCGGLESPRNNALAQPLGDPIDRQPEEPPLVVQGLHRVVTGEVLATSSSIWAVNSLLLLGAPGAKMHITMLQLEIEHPGRGCALLGGRPHPAAQGLVRRQRGHVIDQQQLLPGGQFDLGAAGDLGAVLQARGLCVHGRLDLHSRPLLYILFPVSHGGYLPQDLPLAG